MDGLLKSFEEHSIIWVIVSAGIGGIIGALIKYLFEQVLATRYRHQFDAKVAFRKYKYPILRAADSLDRRLQNFIQFVQKRWYEDPEDNYYRISTLYLLGAYFGWCKILEDEAFIEFETSDVRAKNFNIMFKTVYKGLTGFQYFDEIDDLPANEVESATVPRLAITAVGELMVKKPTEKEKNPTPTVLDFVEFANCIDKSPDFQKWFGHFDKILANVQPSKSCAKWNRVLVFATNMRAFVSFLDTPKRLTAPRTIYYLKRMHPKVRDHVGEELKTHGCAHLVSEDNK